MAETNSSLIAYRKNRTQPPDDKDNDLKTIDLELTEPQFNAVDFLRESNILTEASYAWIRPLIVKVLSDTLGEGDIFRHLDDLFPVSISSPSTTPLRSTELIGVKHEPSKAITEPKQHRIKTVDSIDSVSNIGLLELREPLPIKNGLNVFYGKNAAGKSTVYKSLCKALGLDKSVYPNQHSGRDNCSCAVTVVDCDGIKQTLKWNSGTLCKEWKVKIYDRQYSQVLLEKEQVNEFELSHLKSEYFTLLASMYDEVGSVLNSKLSVLGEKEAILSAQISANAPSYFTSWPQITIEQLKQLNFLEDKKRILENLEAAVKSLERGDAKAVIKNLEHAKLQIAAILNSLGKVQELNQWDGQVEIEFLPNFSDSELRTINEDLENYRAAKKAAEESEASSLESMIPKDWVSNELWTEFIRASIAFVDSLSADEKEKYSKETCIYCQQPLGRREGKALVQIYKNLQAAHEKKLSNTKQKIDSHIRRIEAAQSTLSMIDGLNQIIESEFSRIGREGKVISESQIILDILSDSGSSLQKLKNLIIDEEQLLRLKEFTGYYLDIFREFSSTIAILHQALKDTQKSVNELNKQIASLKQEQELVTLRGKIIEYIHIGEQKKGIAAKSENLSTLRQVTSTLETNFSKSEPLKLFGKYLREEYNKFGFHPPAIFKLKAKSGGTGKNRRYYVFGDKQVSEIFSEGEKTIHTLADFFAEAALARYDGAYILDDPVNSLDEERMEYVGDRIRSLVEQGNQVIIFTHNILFLNCLLETDKEKLHKVSCDKTQVLIERDVKIGTDQELSRFWDDIDKKVKSFKTRTEQEISEFELRETYNSISGFLESYVEVEVFKNVICRYRSNIRMGSLDKLNEVDIKKIATISALYKQTSRKGTRHSRGMAISTEPKYSELMEHYQELCTLRKSPT